MSQILAFNGDTLLQQEFLKLKQRFAIDTIIETGTHVGYTTAVLAEHYNAVHTIETKQEYFDRAKAYCQDKPGFSKINFCFGSSVEWLPRLLATLPSSKRIQVYLDGHWEGEPTPLLKELAAIAASGHKPVLMIHDFVVPGHPELGFDTYDGQPYTYEWIKPALEQIYGKSYVHYFNIKADPASAKRGCIFILPV